MKRIKFDVTIDIDADEWGGDPFTAPGRFMSALLRDKIVKNYSGPRPTEEEWRRRRARDVG
jgi:hypothetical protein